LAKAIANEISKGDWNKLWGFYLGAKRHLTEHADPDQIDAHFPPDVLAGDGSMVGYYEQCGQEQSSTSRYSSI
jgi:hypothetical protein